MKQIVFIFMAILLATGMASAQKKAVISAETTSFDFGTIKEADGKVSHTFEVSNTGDMPLVITRVIASCGCTTPDQGYFRSGRTSGSFHEDHFRIQ